MTCAVGALERSAATDQRRSLQAVAAAGADNRGAAGVRQRGAADPGAGPARDPRGRVHPLGCGVPRRLPVPPGPRLRGPSLSPDSFGATKVKKEGRGTHSDRLCGLASQLRLRRRSCALTQDRIPWGGWGALITPWD